MRVVELKDLFFKSLEEHYPHGELTSFFFMLTEHYLKRSRLDLALEPDYEINSDTRNNFDLAINRLKQNEPIQYIIGSSNFIGLNIKVDKNVLIPRPETEELVRWIINDFENKKTRSKLSLLDIGTGSGCIAVALVHYLGEVHVDALDISEDTLEVARKNARENGVQVNFFKEDILQVDSFQKSYDILVSNPPYVTLSDKERMSVNVVDHEPEQALFVPEEDPLIFYRKILKLGLTNLNEKGSMYFEINEYLSEDLLNLKEIQFFQNIELRKDIYGKDRMIKCSKK